MKIITLRKHPHVRGEDIPKVPLELFAPETPPRTWGRLPVSVDGKPVGGNTPTYVGKTHGVRGRTFRQGKHPHVRGEDGGLSLLPKPRAETPPRTWGRRLIRG